MGNCFLKGDQDDLSLLQESVNSSVNNLSVLVSPPASQLNVGSFRNALDSGSSYILNFPVNRPLINDSEPQLSEEEQIKMAKRCGLITHLPCGIFDGSAKSRECVICMIDFSEGDKVRYLPCMHTYHTECIDDWLMRSFTCPSCLEPVDAALLNTYETS